MRKQRETPHDDFEEVLQSVAGRRFIWRLFDECGIWNEPYVKGDPVETGRQCGMRSWAMGLWRELQAHHFDLFQIMVREAHNDTEEVKKQLDSDKESE